MSASIQVDIKRVIAYASVSHMNICLLGLFSLDISSICGSVILMIAHGLASAGLFFCIGILYSRFHTKNIKCFFFFNTLNKHFVKKKSILYYNKKNNYFLKNKRKKNSFK